MTDEEVRRHVTAGTSSRPEQVRVFYNDGKTALVKHWGARLGRAPCTNWEPSWVDRYDLTQPVRGGWGASGVEVWCCGKNEDGVLTPKRLRALVVKLGLDPRFIR